MAIGPPKRKSACLYLGSPKLGGGGGSLGGRAKLFFGAMCLFLADCYLDFLNKFVKVEIFLEGYIFP